MMRLTARAESRLERDREWDRCLTCSHAKHRLVKDDPSLAFGVHWRRKARRKTWHCGIYGIGLCSWAVREVGFQ